MAALFNQTPLGELLAKRADQAKAQASTVEAERLPEISLEDLTSEVSRQFALQVPLLDRQGITQERTAGIMPGTQLDEGDGPGAATFNLYVPFTGDAELFECQTAVPLKDPVRGAVDGSSLVLTYSMAEPNGAVIRRQADTDLTQIQAQLDRVGREIDQFNAEAQGVVRQILAARQQEARLAGKSLDSPGFPERR